MLKSLYDWTLALAEHRHAAWALVIVAFVESSVFPIPPDILLIPMVLAVRARAWAFAAICTVASVAGGMAGYGIGYGLFESVGRPLIELYGYGAKFSQFQDMYREWGAWIVFTAGISPIPYKVFTIASGVSNLDILEFTGASIGGRGFRYYAVAGLLWWKGPPIVEFIEKRLGLITIVFCVLLLGGFLVAKYAL